jgi:mono/diheme cytochrome c family protein
VAIPCLDVRVLVSIGLLTAGVAVDSLAQSVPPQQCPQPRFTGKAPEPYYSQKNPLPADRDLSAAEALFKGEVQGKFGCAPCHGANGGGDGVLAGRDRATSVAPRRSGTCRTVSSSGSSASARPAPRCRRTRT